MTTPADIIAMSSEQRHEWGRRVLEELLDSNDPSDLATKTTGMDLPQLQVICMVALARLWAQRHHVAGFDIVARQSDTCPTCGSDDLSVCAMDDEPHGQWDNGSDGCCPNAWHDRGQR